MSNRFHSKNHRYNHHTSKTLSTTIPDAGYDPIASHESPFLGDFVINPDGSTLSARDIRTNNILPFSGNLVNVPYPYTLLVSNLSAISATINQVNILVTELSGFVVGGSDNSIHIHDILIPGSNDLSISHAPISSNSWVSIGGDLQTQSDLYVSGVAYIANEFVTNLTAVNLSALNANTYNLTGINNWFTNENVVNSNITSLTATNLSGQQVQTYNLTGINNWFSDENVVNSNITNLTAVNLSGQNVQTYNLTSTNLSALNANIYNLTGYDVSVTNTLSTNNIYPYTAGAIISAHGNIDMLGYSISGIGNTSLVFQNGLTIGTDYGVAAGQPRLVISNNTSLTPLATTCGMFIKGSSLGEFAGAFIQVGTDDELHGGQFGNINRLVGGDTSTKDMYLVANHDNLRIGTQQDKDIVFSTDGWANHRMYITSGGNIGIGTDTPNEKFTVAGTMSALEVITPSLTANNITFNTTTYTGIVTAMGTYLTLTVNGSAVAIPMYGYL